MDSILKSLSYYWNCRKRCVSERDDNEKKWWWQKWIWRWEWKWGKNGDGWRRKKEEKNVHISKSWITQKFDFSINKNTSENLGNSAWNWFEYNIPHYTYSDLTYSDSNRFFIFALKEKRLWECFIESGIAFQRSGPWCRMDLCAIRSLGLTKWKLGEFRVG